MSPKISIITVCFNARAALAATQASVFAQDSDDFEWIVIDGASGDGTVADLQALDDPRVNYLSEPDRGIYDAMNKGLARARGEFVWFLNAGDVFYDETVLGQVSAAYPSADIIFGEAMVRSEDGRVLGLRSEVLPHQCPDQLLKAGFKRGMLVSHQAFVVRRDCAPMYDLSYQLSADLDWMLRILDAAPRSQRLQVLVTIVREGATTRGWKKSQWERFQILAKHFGYVNTVCQHVYIVLRRLGHLLKRACCRG
ncbi:glycosyltransferase family 2 protein [Coraliomargarita sp. W4R53]